MARKRRGRTRKAECTTERWQFARAGSQRPRAMSIPRQAIKLILRRMQQDCEAGNLEVAREALRFCANNRITPPAWVGNALVSVLSIWVQDDGSGQPRKVGRPTQHPWVTILHIWAVKQCEQLPRGRGDQLGKYERAAGLLHRTNPRAFAGLPVLAGASAIKTSYLRFMQSGKIGHMNSAETFELAKRLCDNVDPARVKAANERIEDIVRRLAAGITKLTA
jgi:hypothetical protein